MTTNVEMNELAWLPGHEIARLVRGRQLSPSEVVGATLRQLETYDPLVNAFVTVCADEAMDHARRLDSVVLQTAPEELPALFGVPLTVKDLSPTAGVRTTFGSVAFRDHVPEADSIAVGRLRGAGAILIGKTTTPEFGMLGVTESELSGVTNNPWKLSRTAGGSSGGAAAAAASGIAPLAWGSDGGGSVRIPASYCGVVGLKPSMRWIPGDQSWDSAVTDGPLTRSVVDQALLLGVAAGHHPASPFSVPLAKRDFVAEVLGAAPDFTGLRVAYAETPSGGRTSAEVASVVRGAVDMLSRAGASVDEIDLPLPDPIDYFIDFWGPFFTDPSAPLPHPAMRGVRDAAQRVTLESYLRASSETRGEITHQYNRVFDHYDLLITPTSPVSAFPHPGDVGGNTHVDGQPVGFPAIDFHRYTEPASHAGIPAITLPAGFDSDGLPVGMQFLTPQHTDGHLLELAARWEALNPWAHIRPDFQR